MKIWTIFRADEVKERLEIIPVKKVMDVLKLVLK